MLFTEKASNRIWYIIRILIHGTEFIMTKHICPLSGQMNMAFGENRKKDFIDYGYLNTGLRMWELLN